MMMMDDDDTQQYDVVFAWTVGGVSVETNDNDAAVASMLLRLFLEIQTIFSTLLPSLLRSSPFFFFFYTASRPPNSS
jgi:hypothetical protein